jgi:hypothetical protein
MSIKVNTTQLQSKSTYAASIASNLKEKANLVNNIYYSLDSQVKGRQGIGSSIHSLLQRIEKAQQDMYSISRYLTKAAEQYNIAESSVVARSISDLGNTGANSKTEEKKWYQTNLFKFAVGAVVIGAAVAAAVVVGGPILVGMAVGAAIGAGVGAVTGGVVSKMHGGSFVDGMADGFMWGAIGGAVSGGIGATSVGIVGAAAVEGAVNSATYIGQTLQNDGDVTLIGVASSFVIGAGFSALGTVVSNKISGVFSKNVGNNVDGVVPKAGVVEPNNISPSAVKSSGDTYIPDDMYITELSYTPSSGIKLNATSGETTTILGSYQQDMKYIVDELGNVKSIDFGPRVDGFNVLNVPDELYINPKQFWDEYNKPWLDNAIARHDSILMASEPSFGQDSLLFRRNITTGKYELSGFGKEYCYLRKNGYYFDYNNGKMLFKD